MNRIERLLWEETQVNEIERAKRHSRGARVAKVLWTTVFVTLVAFLATRPWPVTARESDVNAVVAASHTHVQADASNPALRAEPSAETLARSSVAGPRSAP